MKEVYVKQKEGMPDEKKGSRSPEAKFDIRDALLSPCRQCDAFCCKMLFLEEIPLKTLLDLDKVRYYLNFEFIEIILGSQGVASVYYMKSCRFLKEENNTCTIHNQPVQPSVCVHYNPYHCFYRNVSSDRKKTEYGHIWLNAARLKKIEEQLRFDEDRRIIKGPDFSEMITLLEGIPYLSSGEAEKEEKKTAEKVPVREPCLSCSGLCCHLLLFPQPAPETYGNVDFGKYMLGFPGVEYIIKENNWYLAVSTRCRYLKGSSCSLYNLPERPLFCRYLDPCKCWRKKLWKSGDKLQLDYEKYLELCRSVKFGENDEIVEIAFSGELK